MKGEATAVLRTLLAVEPLYWTSFYERARFFRGRPTPAPPEVIFDLTKDCPLDCAFCFAADTLHSGVRIHPEELAPLAESLSGLPRVLLLGGEPLTHPELDACLELLDEPGRQICIYTNGLPIPEEAERRRRWLLRHFGRLSARVELTLSLDSYHREQLGDAAFAARIEALIALIEGPDSPVDVRFNVTASSLSTGGYLVPEQVERALDALHPALTPLFRRSMRAGDVEKVFQFNPVIRMGRALEGELLNAGDTLLKPQVVIGPLQKGGTSLLTSLPATWMLKAPAPLVVGEIREAALAEILLDGPVAWQLGADVFSELSAAFVALVALREGSSEASELLRRAVGELSETSESSAPARALRYALQRADASLIAAVLRVYTAWSMSSDWPTWRERWHDRLARRLVSLCESGEQAWDLGGDRPHRRLVLATLRRFLTRYLREDSARAAAFIERCVEIVLEPLRQGGYAGFCGYEEREGLITDRPESPLPLSEVPLDQAVATPYFGDALVAPRVVARMAVQVNGAVQLELDGVGTVYWAAQTVEREARQGQGALLGMLEFLLPERLHALFRERLGERSQALWERWQRRAELERPAGLKRLLYGLGSLDALPVQDKPIAGQRDLARLLLSDAAPVLADILVTWRKLGAAKEDY